MPGGASLPLHDNLLTDSPVGGVELVGNDVEMAVMPPLHEQQASKPVTPHEVEVRPAGVDVYMMAGFGAGVAWLITGIVLSACGLNTDDDGQTWPVVVTWVECAVSFISLSLYVNRYLVKERVPIVMESVLVWQMMVLNALFVCISTAFPARGQEQQTFPAGLLVSVYLAGPVILDACNTTRTESRVYFVIMIVALLLGMIGNMLLFENTILYEGYHVTVDTQGRQVWTGQFTKNGVRFSILYTELLLMMGSLFTAFVYDKDHTMMYFCKMSIIPHSLCEPTAAVHTRRQKEEEGGLSNLSALSGRLFPEDTPGQSVAGKAAIRAAALLPLHENHLLNDPADGVPPQDEPLVGIELVDNDVEMAVMPPGLLHEQQANTPHQVGVRPAGVDVYMMAVWAAGVALIINLVVLPLFGVNTDDDQIWPVVITWVECVAGFLCCGLYVNRYLVKERVPIVVESVLAWQMMVLNALFVCISTAFPARGQEQQTFPAGLLVFLWCSVPVILDACNTTRTESNVTFALLIVSLLLGMIGNVLLFENTILHEGLYATVDSQGRQVWTGQITKNGVRLNILYTELLLMMGSLFTAFVYDKDHTMMYFCKLSRDKIAITEHMPKSRLSVSASRRINLRELRHL